MSDAVLFFEEIAGNRRKVVLRATAAPLGAPRRKAAFELGGGIRGARVYEPHDGPPVRHKFGSNEKDLEVEGHFRDGMIGIPGEAERQRALIEAIRRDQEDLRILWNGLVRRGVLAETTFGIEGGSDYTYKLKFEIDEVGDGADAETGRPRVAFPSLDPSDLADTISGLKASLVSVPGISLDLASGLNDLFAAAFNPLGQLIGAFEDVEAGVDDLADAFRRAANAAAALLSRLQHLAGTIGAVSDPTDTDDGAARAAWERRRAEALLALADVSKRALALGTEAEKRLRGSTSGRYVVVSDGDTIESIGARERVSASAIRDLNPGVGFAPAVGTKLRLP